MKKVGIYLTCQGYLVKKAIELVYPDFKVFFYGKLETNRKQKAVI